MNEEFVTFELSKKLKEKGFPQKTGGRFSMIGSCYFEDGRFYEDGLIGEVDYCFTAPTIAQALKWLREDKKIHICVDIFHCGWCYDTNTDIRRIDGNFEFQHIISGSESFDTYESAILAGIQYTLDSLI